MELSDLKPLIDEGNKTIAALRAEMDTKKAADVVSTEKLARIETDLAKTLSEKAALELRLKAQDDRMAEIETKANRPGGLQAKQVEADEHKASFLEFMRKGQNGGAAERLFELQQKAVDVRVGTAASGGFALPKQISDQITKQLLDISAIRAIAKVVQVGSPDYHEIVDSNGLSTEWLGEVDVHNQTNTPSFNDVAPTFGELSAKPEATRQSLNDLFFDVEALLIDRAAEAFAIAEGVAFISGNGVNKPTGFLTGTPVATADAARAFGTLQYVATGVAATLAADPYVNTKDMIASLKNGYRLGSVWLMNSLTQAALAKIKDTQGRYLLQTDVAAGMPYKLEGYDVMVAEDMPVVAANSFPIAFGNFKKGYVIADIAGMWMVRDEITKPGYIRFPMSKRVGGKMLDSNAIKLMKVALS